MSKQVNLHQHLEFSFLDGAARPEEVASRANELGQRAVAITDQWRPVVGYEGFYEVSTSGGVRSLERVVSHGGRLVRRNSALLTPNLSRGRRCTKGHLRVYLSRDGKTNGFYVHRLVLEAFVSLAPPGAKGLHRDDDPYNNSVGNLYWGSDQENAIDIIANGNNPNVNKTECKRGHALHPPNLSTAHLVHGRRSCVACSYARERARKNGRPGDEAYIQEVSDQKYALVLGGAR